MNVEERGTTSDAVASADQPTLVYERDRDETATEAVVAALAAALDIPTTEMTPIYDVVDPDALDTLFRPGGGRPRPGDCRVAFEYDGHRVRVESDGRVYVY